MSNGNKIFISLLSLLLLVSLASMSCSNVKAQSRTITVPDDFPSISLAVKNATDGDIVYVRSGTYTENELRINKPIILMGESQESTRLNLQSTKHDEPLYPEYPDLYRAIWYDTAMAVNADNFVISDFTISTTGGDINITGNGNTVKSNSISAAIAVFGDNNRVIENTLSEGQVVQKSINCNIAGNNCNFSANGVNSGSINFVGKFGVVSFNNIKSSFIAWSDDCFFYNNFFSDATYGEFRVNGNNNIICKNILDHYGSGLAIIGKDNKAMLNNITYCRIAISPSPDSTMYANFIAFNEWTINSRNAIINPYGNLSFLFHNNFVDNRYYQMWTIVMSNITDYLDNGKEGNYWNYYNGSDNNGDGIGDSPFYLDPTHLDRYPLMNPVNLSTIEEVLPDWLIIPTINLVSPENITYFDRNISVSFSPNKQVSWIGYSFDGLENVTINGNLTLMDLPFGAHNITVYAIDQYANQGSSETISFTVEEPELLPLSLVVILTISILSICLIGILLFRRHRKSSNLQQCPSTSQTSVDLHFEFA